MKKLFFIALVLTCTGSFCQSIVYHPGIFSLGKTNFPTSATIYTKPFVAGGEVRVTWDTLNPTDGVYDWNYLDGEILTAKNAGKKIGIAVMSGSRGTPSWVKDSLPVQPFYYIDMNPNHPSYLDTLKMPIPWDSIYLAKLCNFIQSFGNQYGNDTNIAYVQNASGMVTEGWGLASADVYGNSWALYGYTPDTLLYAFKKVLDTYMTAFPSTPEWIGVGNIAFEPALSGNIPIYVGEQMALYGFATYPNRFNVWREDFNACFPAPPSSTSFWHILWDHPCQNGAQAVWSVQDGSDCTFRMSNCDTTICSKDTVMWRAIQRCLDYKMFYLEIYAADVMDNSLSATLQKGADSLNSVWQNCQNVLSISETLSDAASMTIYPNPFSETTTLQIINGRITNPPVGPASYELKMYDLFGREVRKYEIRNEKTEISRGDLPGGMYFYRLTSKEGLAGTGKCIVQ